eukprot:CAMPEP_0172170562 /NCGR_PEP_ID=MMETSP1050-20130122/11346_1 /TAXON_ID=233186 /ORGANISM="Cryptomonas curvata, Strain CCAP979/52" /LENGTH=119 /DNA_ID=CAMNT_0012841777 /DNA_START=1129 /DNA_END=1488 /DNA_ORIENTATION=-
MGVVALTLVWDAGSLQTRPPAALASGPTLRSLPGADPARMPPEHPTAEVLHNSQAPVPIAWAKRVILPAGSVPRIGCDSGAGLSPPKAGNHRMQWFLAASASLDPFLRAKPIPDESNHP